MKTEGCRPSERTFAPINSIIAVILNIEASTTFTSGDRYSALAATRDTVFRDLRENGKF